MGDVVPFKRPDKPAGRKRAATSKFLADVNAQLEEEMVKMERRTGLPRAVIMARASKLIRELRSLNE